MAGAVSCPRCNKRLPREANFCRRCGTGLAGRSAPPLPPPLVSTGYGDPAAGWRGSSAGDDATVLGYVPRGTRRPKPKSVPPPPPRAAISVRGWWLFILLGIFGFRACATHSSKWESPRYRPPPTIRSAPRHDPPPPVREDHTPWPTRDGHGHGSH